MKEPGEPVVQIQCTPEGVTLRLEATLTGAGADWEREIAETWFGELWVRLGVAASLHADYGLTPSPTPPELAVMDAPPVPMLPPHEDRAPVPPPQRLESLIERAETNGTALSQTKPSVAIWKRKVLAALEQAPPRGLTRVEIDMIDASVSRSTSTMRLRDLQNERLLYFHEEGGHNRGFWRLRSREPETEGDLPRADVITAALPYTRGKRFLMLGGGGDKPHRARMIERVLSLAELRWPVIDEQEPIETWLREIRRTDIDVVIINRWTRKHGRHLIHAAQEWDKPFLYLTHGSSAIQIAQGVREQWIERRAPVAVG